MKKTYKISLLINTILMYCSGICTLISIECIYLDAQNDLSKTFFISGIVFGIINLLFGFSNIIIALTGFRKDSANPTLFVSIIKVILIPYYCINLYSWFSIIAGMFNPFLMIGIPIAISLGIALTYITIIYTSSHNIVYILKLLKDNKCDNKNIFIALLIGHFIFGIDVISSMILSFKTKKLIRKKTS